MKRMIHITEDELDVLINRAFFTGVCAQKKGNFLIERGTFADRDFLDARDEARNTVKRIHFEKG